MTPMARLHDRRLWDGKIIYPGLTLSVCYTRKVTDVRSNILLASVITAYNRHIDHLGLSGEYECIRMNASSKLAGRTEGTKVWKESSGSVDGNKRSKCF